MVNYRSTPRYNQCQTTTESLFPATLSTASALVDSGELDAGRYPDDVWLYEDEQGDPVLAVCRWNVAGGRKIIRPLHRTNNGEWRPGSLPEPRPLYRLPLLLTRAQLPVIVVEGEKCADAGNREFGDMAVFTTSPHGARAADKADWKPLAGRKVYIWPDADEAGLEYAQSVARLVTQARAEYVAILDPNSIAGCQAPEGWDAADAVAECGEDEAKLRQLRDRLSAAMRDAKRWHPWVSWGFDCSLNLKNTEIALVSVRLCRDDMPSPGLVVPPTRVALTSEQSRNKVIELALEKWTEKAREWQLDAEITKFLAEELRRTVKKRLEEGAWQVSLGQAAETKQQDNETKLVRVIEAWPEPVGLADVLDDIVELLMRYVAFESPSEAKLVALWIALTYCFEKFSHLPLLVITSATWRCGKSRLLMLVGWLSQRAFDVSMASVSAIFRLGQLYKPTLLLDEADNNLLGDRDFAAIFNAGADKEHATVVRAEPVGETFLPTGFNVYFPKALAGIALENCLRGSTLDRSLIIKLSRACVQPLQRADVKSQADLLARKLCRAIADSELQDDYALLPDWLLQRDADMMLPLVAIASAAGERWRTETLEAIEGYLKVIREVKLHPSERLLLDILEVYEQTGASELSAEELAERLNHGDFEWAERRGGRGVSAAWVGRTLKRFGISPHKTRHRRLYDVYSVRETARRYCLLVDDEETGHDSC